MTREAADWVRGRNDLELVDFTGDGYKTLVVRGDGDAIQQLMDDFGYTWRGGPGGDVGEVLDRADDPPDTLWLPDDESQGGCYHAIKCGAHRLEEVPLGEAVSRIADEGLEPCTHCERHHGLDVSVGRRSQ